MDNDVEVYMVDDERNAARVVSHRQPPAPSRQPAPSRAPTYYPQPPQQMQRAVYPTAYPQPYPYPAQPRVVVVQSQRRPSIFDALSTVDIGQAVKTAGGVIASFKSLPAPPVAAGPDNHDRIGQDLRNLTKYQTATFEHGKADERLRTVFNLLGDAVTFFVKAAAR